MAEGNEYTSVWRTGEADERLKQYQKRINDGLAKFSGEKEKFVKHMALFILSEVRNERKTMQELGTEIRNIYDKFKV